MNDTQPGKQEGMETDRRYMQRCLELAARGAGSVAPNPMVGAVLVYNDRIIGEGYHERYGEAHAEPNCIRAAIQAGHEAFFPDSTLYVSLEPCAHFGKTPPCADLIIRHGIGRVVIGCRDPFPQVNGRGIEKLEAAGISVRVGIEEEACRKLNRRFFRNHEQQRPYVILKWAETADGYIARATQEERPLKISNDYTDRLVHRWRSEEASILVGTRTAVLDDPALTTRHWPGKSPVRMVIDTGLKLPPHLKLLDGSQPTIVFNTLRHDETQNPFYYRLNTDGDPVTEIVKAVHQLRLQSVIVEGGAQLLQSFITSGLWDEARVIRNPDLRIDGGIASPLLHQHHLTETIDLLNDRISIYTHTA